VQCNDDGPSTVACRGTNPDSVNPNYGSRITGTSERGINAVLVDERTRANGLRYTMRHQIPN
jgi:hypothetical protein